MNKIPLSLAVALSAAWLSSAMPSSLAAGLPERHTGVPVANVMQQHASLAGAACMQSPRQLASPVGMLSRPLNLPAITKAATDASAIPELYGSVIYADGWTQQNNAIGMYRIGTSDQIPFERTGTARIDATAGGVAVGNAYYASYTVNLYGSFFAYTLKYDIDTWTETPGWDYWSDMKLMSTGAVYDRTTGKIYGCFYNDTQRGFVFGTADYETLKRVAIKDLDRQWSAVAMTRQGALYAIEATGDLYSVDKTTGNMTLIGNTGLVATNPSSACIDPRSGRCFYAVTQGTDGSLYEINLATAQATLIYHFPQNQEVVGMFVPVPDVEDGAPDAITGLQLSFPDGTLTGTVSFTCPANTFDGAPGTGTLTYVIEANGLTVASGQAAYGQSVQKQVTFQAPGDYKIKVYATNSVGDGPAAESEMFIGNDLPQAPQLTATMGDGTVTLSWEPVTASVNGGYIDLDNLTYTVTRMPDNHTVAAATTLTSVTDTPPAEGTLTGFRYVVTAQAGSYTSAESISRTFWTGSVMPPYTVVFETESNGEAFTVHDVNNDGHTWQWSQYDQAFKTSFNRSADMDDWLVTPPLKLEKGKMYMFTARMRTYLGNPLNVEIKWGTGDSPESLTSTLMEPQQIRNRTAENYSFYLLPETDGTYYVGIHETTPANDSWYLFVDGITVGAGVDAIIPDEVEDFTVTPDFNGGTNVAVSLKAPAKGVDGTPLANIERIDILRDEAVVKTFLAPAPGASLEFTDEVPDKGYHKYETLAYSAAGAGKKVTLTVFVGANEPARPAWVRLEETSVPGQVTMTWEEVTVDKDGKALNPDLVTYTIIAAGEGDEPVFVAENIQGTSHTFRVAVPAGGQAFAGYGLRAQTEGGYSLMAVTEMIPVGTPYAAPWSESFAGGAAHSLMRSENRDGLWSIYTDESGITSHDGDNGMAAMFGEFAGADATLFSGKISLTGLANPALTFYTYCIDGEDDDRNEIEVSVNEGNGFATEKLLAVSDLGNEDGWYLVTVPLDRYKNKVIQFSMRGITRTHRFTMVDDISVTSLDTHNLRMTGINAPATVQPGKEFFVAATIENFSVSEATDYTVKLFRNNEEVATVPGEPLAPGRTAIIRFAQTLGVADSENSGYHAEIEYSADRNTADNISDIAAVKLALPDYPAPRNLAATADDNSVSLTWDSPDLTAAVPGGITEDFEEFESWSKTGDKGWIFVDADQAGIGQIGNYTLPGIDYNSTLSWFVTDASMDGLPAAFAAASGDKYLSTMFCLPDMSGDIAEYIPNDDWAISPLLFGGAQTVTLMARSMNPAEAEESFEILVSDTDSDTPADFIMLEKTEKVPGTWTPYSFDLPQGTRRFAIRYNHTFGLSLGIDDVSFIPAGTSTLVLEGYNVYRDGKRINDTLVSGTSFTDPIAITEPVIYAVTAIYGSAGESRLSDPLRVERSGLSLTDSADIPTIKGIKDAIVVAGAEGLKVTVTDTLGRTIASTDGTLLLTIPVQRGAYVVTAGPVAVKVLVP